MDKAERTAMDEKALEAAYDTLGRPDHAGDRLTVRTAILAYEAAKPAPMSASGEMVERAFEIGYCWRGMLVGQTLEDSRAVCRTLGADVFEGLNIDASEVPGFEDADIGIYHAKRAIRKALVAEAASRLESLEALFAEQAGELESAESHAQMMLLAVEAGDPKPELAMRVKDLISVLSDIRKARGKE